MGLLASGRCQLVKRTDFLQSSLNPFPYFPAPSKWRILQSWGIEALRGGSRVILEASEEGAQYWEHGWLGGANC